MSRPFILCADDFGLTPGVNEAILDLCARRRLSAVSAMVTAPAWRADATRLRDFGKASGVEVGIHLCFSEFPPLTPAPSLAPGGRPRGPGRLLAAILAGRLRRKEIAGEIARQIETFAGAVGRLPDFLDGHHHAHQFSHSSAGSSSKRLGRARGRARHRLRGGRRRLTLSRAPGGTRDRSCAASRRNGWRASACRDCPRSSRRDRARGSRESADIRSCGRP
jgi:chitin disaccharide deacetylase